LYLALTTSTPMNVTLVGASTPVWMLLIGRVFFGTPVSQRQLVGAFLSIAGVLLVLCRGQWEMLLHLQCHGGCLYAARVVWMGVLQLDAGPSDSRIRQYSGRLGRFFARANRVWPHGCPALQFSRMDAYRYDVGLGMALGSGIGFYCFGPSRHSLSIVGCGGCVSRSSCSWIFYQPHAIVCSGTVFRLFKRAARALSHRVLCSYRFRYRTVIQALKSSCVGPTINQNILAGDVASQRAAQKGTHCPKLVG